jgi:hypothetical protein
MFQNMVYIPMTRTGRHSSNEERIDAIHLLERGCTEAQAALILDAARCAG